MSIKEGMGHNGETQVPLSVVGLDCIREWIQLKIDETNYSSDDMVLPDCIKFGDSITFIDIEKKQYRFILDELQLSPSDGSQDEIDLHIRDNDNNSVASGYIQVTYGFIEEDEDGGIDDGCEEDIEYCTLEIEEFIEEKVNALEEFKIKQESMVEYLRSIFNL